MLATSFQSITRLRPGYLQQTCLPLTTVVLYAVITRTNAELSDELDICFVFSKVSAYGKAQLCARASAGLVMTKCVLRTKAHTIH